MRPINLGLELLTGSYFDEVSPQCRPGVSGWLGAGLSDLCWGGETYPVAALVQVQSCCAQVVIGQVDSCQAGISPPQNPLVTIAQFLE